MKHVVMVMVMVMVMDKIGHNMAHINARNARFVFTPQNEIIALQKRMGWRAPGHTDHGRRFSDDFNGSIDVMQLGRQPK